MYQTKVLTDLAAEPVSLAEMKEFMEIDFTDFDALITRLIKSARIASEKFTGLSYGTKEIELTSQGKCSVQLPFGPVQTVDSVKDANGDDVEYLSFGFDNPIVTLKHPIGILTTSPIPNQFNVIYTTGFDECPEDLKEAIKKRVETAFQFRADAESSDTQSINEAINKSTDLEFAYRVSPLFGLV